MSILQGYKKVKRYIKENDGYREISQHVYSDTVEMSDGTDLETTVTNMETELDSKVPTSRTVNGMLYQQILLLLLQMLRQTLVVLLIML